MDGTARFEEAQSRVRLLKRRPGNEELLELYALYKQATAGDNATPRPGIFDVKGRLKWQRWKEKKGMTAATAMSSYAELVRELELKYGAG